MTTVFSVAPKQQLRRYAEVIVHCGLGHGAGIKPGEKVVVSYNQESAGLVSYLQQVITVAGGHLLHDCSYDFARAESPADVLLECGTDEQLSYMPIGHKQALYEEADHRITLKCQVHLEPSALSGTPAAKTRRLATAEITALLREYREQHWSSYTLVYVPTEAMAAEAGVSLAEYWQVIVDGCYLEQTDAVKKVRTAQSTATKTAAKLSAKGIESLHVKGQNVDLRFKLEETARFVSSGGGNLPSFEVFTAPAASTVKGWIKSAYPVLFEKERIGKTHFTFKFGKCVEAVAEQGQAALDRMLDLDGMDKIGEFAMTDKKQSQIRTVLPGATLFMENVGGTIHFAFGNAIAKCFVNKQKGSDANKSKKHLDFVCSGECTVTAHLQDGTSVVVFQDGSFTI